MSYIIEMALGIKARFEPPTPMTSPLETYCIIGTTARAVKLELPERKGTFFRMRDQLNTDMGGNKPEDSRIARIRAILRGLVRNGDITDQMMERIIYGYENEK